MFYHGTDILFGTEKLGKGVTTCVIADGHGSYSYFNIHGLCFNIISYILGLKQNWVTMSVYID